MKSIIFFIAVLGIIIFAACKKEGNDNSNLAIRYEFTSTISGNFSIEGRADTIYFSSTLANGNNWSRTINVIQNTAVPDSAVLTLHPPPDWTGTDIEADITLKIFVNNVLKAFASEHLFGIDRPVGVTIVAPY